MEKLVKINKRTISRLRKRGRKPQCRVCGRELKEGEYAYVKYDSSHGGRAVYECVECHSSDDELVVYPLRINNRNTY